MSDTTDLKDQVHRLDQIQREIRELQAEFLTRERILVKALIEMKAVEYLKPIYPVIKRTMR